MILYIFIIYLCVLAGIGLWFTKYNKNLGDFVLGGRRLGPWVTAISAQASDMSGWLLVGLPAAAYVGGFSILWVVIGLAFGTLFNWVFVAPRLRRITEEQGALTVPDFLESRFKKSRYHEIRILAIIVIILFYASYIAAQFIAAGKIFESVFSDVSTPWGLVSFDYHTGIIIGAAIILIYTLAGGFLAVAYTDLVQGLIMVFAVVVIPIFAIVKIGSLENLWGILSSIDAGKLMTLSGGKTGSAFLIGTVVGGMSWGLGYPGQPHIIVRFMAIKNPTALKMATLISMIWVVLALYGAMFVGFSGHAILGNQIPDPDHVFPMLATSLFPPWMAGIIIAAAVAAMMSTVDSQLMVAISAFTEDIYVKLFGGKVGGKKIVNIGRLVGLVLGIAAIAIAWKKDNVFDQVFDAWGGLAAGFAPAICMSLLYKKVTRQGVFFGMLVGVVLIQLWPWIAGHIHHPLVSIWPGGLVPAFSLNIFTVWFISRLCSRR